jgi:hypothetical protein
LGHWNLLLCQGESLYVCFLLSYGQKCEKSWRGGQKIFSTPFAIILSRKSVEVYDVIHQIEALVGLNHLVHIVTQQMNSFLSFEQKHEKKSPPFSPLRLLPL